MTMADRCGKWSHVVWTLSETGTFQGYINGNFIGTGCTNCIYTPGDSEVKRLIAYLTVIKL